MNIKKKKGFNGRISRKEQRRDKRKEKKQKKNSYFSKGKNNSDLFNAEPPLEVQSKPANIQKKNTEKSSPQLPKTLTIEEIHLKEKKEQKKIQKDMSHQRKEQLLKANASEDKLIKKLEKQLKLNKRKTKNIPKSFHSDGLDYLLEVCDPEFMKNVVTTEQDLQNGVDDFEEDFALMTGQSSSKVKKNQSVSSIESDSEDGSGGDECEELLNEDDGDDDGSDEELSDEEVESESDLGTDTETDSKKRKLALKEEAVQCKKLKLSVSNNESVTNEEKEEETKEKDEVWEDIYGRLRTKDGAVIEKTESKYIPPAIRAQMEAGGTSNEKQKLKLDRLKKQLKGLLNRLAESNMYNISKQVEQLYMSNSRNDMSETLTFLITESLLSSVLTPERLLMEHIVLIAVLHANVGSEVGAYFLQTVAKRFESLLNTEQNVEDKSLDNTVNVLAQLYNFKVFDAKLLYEILQKLSEQFDEKHIDCILHILRNVGFSLRKDDPLALKSLILELQKQAAKITNDKVNNSRVKFLLDVLLAIRNNNVTKIPNYDTSYPEHLKKLMKGFIRKGNYITPLNISLEDLLKADERGKWWVVGSAWTGKSEKAITQKDETPQAVEGFSQEMLDLAKKQRMNTDTRRNIFCIIVSAEDYLDAFEKLLRLGLKNLQEREIIHVIIHCCLQENPFNAYYAVLAQKFCEYDRRFQMTIKCSVWDKLKTLKSHSGPQIANLAKLLTHLFVRKGLPISTLKTVEFAELDKVTSRFIRQILLGVLLHKDFEEVQAVFTTVAMSEKLKMFRESLRLFIHHFLLKNLKEGTVAEEQKEILQTRAKLVEKILAFKESKNKW